MIKKINAYRKRTGLLIQRPYSFMTQIKSSIRNKKSVKAQGVDEDEFMQGYDSPLLFAK